MSEAEDEMMFKLRFDPGEIRHLAQCYEYTSDEMIEQLVPDVQKAGYLTKKQLLIVGEWKSPRIVPRLRSNPDSLVREATRIALETDEEGLRIGVPQLLSGVGLPVSSVLLHFFHKDDYPILDYRALWSLNAPKANVYNIPIWLAYVETCRHLAQEADVSMRTLDRALWQYSKENQTTTMA